MSDQATITFIRFYLLCLWPQFISPSHTPAHTLLLFFTTSIIFPPVYSLCLISLSLCYGMICCRRRKGILDKILLSGFQSSTKMEALMEVKNTVLPFPSFSFPFKQNISYIRLFILTTAHTVRCAIALIIQTLPLSRLFFSNFLHCSLPLHLLSYPNLTSPWPPTPLFSLSHFSLSLSRSFIECRYTI